jgi:hypothetical protein
MKDRFEQWIAADDAVARRFRVYLQNRVINEDGPPETVVVMAWVRPDGQVERVAFAPLKDKQANDDLKAILTRGNIGEPPPPDLLQPVHLRLSLRRDGWTMPDTCHTDVESRRTFKRAHDMLSRRSIGSPVVAVVLFVALAASASAQQSVAPSGVVIGGNEPQVVSHERCVEVEIGHERSLGCLNEQLKRQVDRINPVPNIPPIDAKSQDIRVGVFNQMALRQQYGQNFGRSVIPFRPPPPVFTAPGVPRR